MKKHFTITHFVAFVFAIGVSFAVGTSAYDLPQKSAPAGSEVGNNADAPINTTDINQIKDGGLSINVFTARDNAQFLQKVTFNGLVRGGTPTDTSSTLNFGDGSHNVGVNVRGTTANTGAIKVADLAHTYPTPQKVCAGVGGVLELCP